MSQPTFLKNDTHYSARGSYSLYGSLLSYFDSLCNGFEPVEFNDLDIEIFSSEGDLGSKLDHPEFCDHSVFVLPSCVSVMGNGVRNIGGVIYSLNHFAKNKSRIMLFGNSFVGGSFLQLLQVTFKEVMFIFSPSIHYGLVKAFSPDFVLLQYLERFLPWVASDDGLSVFDFSALKVLCDGGGFLYPSNVPLSHLYCIDARQYLMARMFTYYHYLPPSELEKIKDLLTRVHSLFLPEYEHAFLYSKYLA